MAGGEETNGQRWQHYHTVVLFCLLAVFISYIDRSNISVAAIDMKEQFHWNETRKGIVLASFFVGYMLLQITSGTLANRFGGWIVLLLAVTWWSFATIITPPAALLSFPALIAARLCLGLGEAAVFPASINMVGRWVPAAERSRMVALFSSGVPLGTVISLPATGWLVHHYGWPRPFYVFGAAGLVWAALWLLLVRRGRGVEVETTVRAIDATGRIPWRRILGEPAVWALVAAHFAHNWTLYVLLAWMPSYFHAVFGLSTAAAGLISAAPWLVNFATANIAGSVSGKLIARGRSATRVRKSFLGSGLLVGGCFLLLLRAAPSPVAGVIFMCGATGAFGCVLASFATNSFDIAPRYADVVWSFTNTFATIPGILGVFITGWLVQHTGGYSAPFFLSAAVVTIGAFTFLRFGSGERRI